MNVFTLLLVFVAGVVLRANSGWFNGAHTVGTVCVAASVVALAIIVLFIVLAAVVVGFTRR